MAHKPLVFHRLAEREIRSARKWYRERSVDAPRKFREEIDVAVAKMIQRSQSFPDYIEGTKRVLFERFPYMIVFKEYPAHFFVVAVADGRRKPGYWRKRLK